VDVAVAPVVDPAEVALVVVAVVAPVSVVDVADVAVEPDAASELVSAPPPAHPFPIEELGAQAQRSKAPKGRERAIVRIMLRRT